MKSYLSIVRRAFPLVVVGLLAGGCNSVESTSGPSAVVLDEDGAYGSAAKPVNPATVSFRYRCSGLTCSFSDTSNCPTDTTRLWTFGDGGTAIGTVGGKVTHTYGSAGSYAVTLATSTCWSTSKSVDVK